MLSKNTAYLSRLDHLRFFAAFLVLIYHWHAWAMIQANDHRVWLSIVREGETGVSLFMVMSGFILTRISLGRQINYRSFIYNRFVRIYPLYLFALFVDAYSNNRAMNFLSFLQFLLPIGNLHGDQLPKFGTMWTIAVEFQFYLIFPFLAAFLARFGIRYIAGIILMAIIARTMCYFADGSVRDAAYWTILGRIDQFCIGMLAAVLYSKRQRMFSSPLLLPVAVIVLYVWVFAFEHWTGGGYYAEGSDKRIAWIFTPTLEATMWAFFSLVYLAQRWAFPRALDRILALLGAASFSIYAWHWPLLKLIQKYPRVSLSHSWFVNFVFIVFPLVMAVSILSYYIIEWPFLEQRRKYVSSTNEGGKTHSAERAIMHD